MSTLPSPRLAALGPLAYQYVTVETPPLTDEQTRAIVALIVDGHNMEPWYRGARGYAPILAARRQAAGAVHMIERRVPNASTGIVLVTAACLRIASFERVKLVVDEALVRGVVAAMPCSWSVADRTTAQSVWADIFARERAWVPTDDVWATDDTRAVTCEECLRALAHEHKLARLARGIDAPPNQLPDPSV